MNGSRDNQISTPRLSRRQALQLGAAGMGSAALVALLQACSSPAPAAPPAAAKPTAAPAAAQPTAAPAPPQPTTVTAPPTAAPAAAVKPTEAAKPATAAGPKRGGILRIGQEQDPISIDPYKSSNFSSVQQFDLFYNALTRFNEKLEVVPDLAISWETPSPTEYVFKLRPGVKFHSGKDFDADDVKYSLDWMLDEKNASVFRSLFTPIEQVTAVDKMTVRLKLKAPYAPLLATIANRRGSVIIPKDFYERNNGNINTVADGTGPFKLVEFTPGTRMRLERNPNYYGMQGGQNLPYLDGIDIQMMYDEAARVAAIRTGNVEFITLISAESAELFNNNAETKLFKTPAAQVRYFVFNVRRKPFDDIRVRQAFDLALDRQEVIDQTLAGNADLTGVIPTGYGDWSIDPKELPYKIDIPKAKQLLAEAGFPDGLKTTVLVSAAHVVEMVNPAIVIKQQLAKIGVDLTIDRAEFSSYVARFITQPDFDVGIGGHSFRADPDGYLYELFHSTSGTNMTGTKDPALDKDLEAARQELDHAKRRQMYFDIQKKAMELKTLLPLYGAKNFEVVRKDVEGFIPMVTTRRTTLEQSWLNK